MRTVKATPVDDIEYTHGDLTFRMRGDCEGIMPWLELDEQQKPVPLTIDTYSEFLIAVVYEADWPKVLAATEAGDFGPKAGFDAARTAWANAQRLLDFNTLASRITALHAHYERVEAMTATLEAPPDLDAAAAAVGEEDAPPADPFPG